MEQETGSLCERGLTGRCYRGRAIGRRRVGTEVRRTFRRTYVCLRHG